MTNPITVDTKDGGEPRRAEVRLGRWQDVLLGTYDRDRAVVITDPPYGLGAPNSSGNGAPGIHPRGRLQVDTRAGHETGKGYEDVIPWGRHVEEVLDLLPAKRHAIRGPATTLIRRDFPQPRRVCVELAAYRKRALNRPGIVPYLWQGWAVYGRLKVDRHRAPPKGDALASTFMLQRGTNDHRGKRSNHRAMTPYAACIWIVDTWVDPGDLVLDPYAGLGTIGLAARTLGFDYLGSELDPEYAAIANDSFLHERLTLDLSA